MFILKNLFSIIKNNKYLIILGLGLTFLFVTLLLPYQDINTYISSQINTYTNGKVQFTAKKFLISPFMELQFMDSVTSYKKIEVPIKKIAIKPLWLQSLLLNFGIEVNAHSIFEGNIQLVVKKNKSKKHPLAFNAYLQNISLEKLPLPFIKLHGKISANIKTLINPHWLYAPNIYLEVINNKKIQVFRSKIPSPFGPIQIPLIHFSKLKIKAATQKEVLNIQNLELGSSTDALYIKIAGTAALTIKKQRRKNTLSIKNYKLSVYIKAQQPPPSWKSLLALLDNYKTGNVYQFHIKGNSLNAIPELTR